MLDTDVNSFLDIPVADSLVNDYTHCGFGDIVDDAGLAVVNLVGHAVVLIREKSAKSVESKREDRPLLNGPVGFDINNIPDSWRPVSPSA